MDLTEAFQQYVAATSPYPLGLNIVGAEGCYLEIANGERYLDLVSGLAVCNVGHRHPKVVSAIKHQADKYLHVIPYGEFVQQPQVEFAERITSVLPEGLEQVYFVNSGTEAIEGALKLAKRATGRTRLIGCCKSYHGSTHGSLSLTGNEQKKYRNRPLLPDVHHIHFNRSSDLTQIDQQVAAVVVEPIQGDAGVRMPSAAWLQDLRTRCDDTGALLVFDEVQTGFGRTGKFFAFEHFDVVPDILVLGKALGGGMPLGAFICSQERMRQLSVDPPLGHITTFGGHPVCCAAGLAALNVLIEQDLAARAREAEDRFRSRLEHPAVREIRGKGLMLAIELEDPDLLQRMVFGCLEQGVLGFWFLSCPTAFRLAPPLTISDEQIDHACAVFLAQLDRHVVQN